VAGGERVLVELSAGPGRGWSRSRGLPWATTRRRVGSSWWR